MDNLGSLISQKSLEALQKEFQEKFQDDLEGEVCQPGASEDSSLEPEASASSRTLQGPASVAAIVMATSPEATSLNLFTAPTWSGAVSSAAEMHRSNTSLMAAGAMGGGVVVAGEEKEQDFVAPQPRASSQPEAHEAYGPFVVPPTSWSDGEPTCLLVRRPDGAVPEHLSSLEVQPAVGVVLSLSISVCYDTLQFLGSRVMKCTPGSNHQFDKKVKSSEFK